MYKTREFALGSFSTGHPGGRILVEQQDKQDSHPNAGTYKWTCAFEVYYQAGPQNNYYENQTVLIKGFRMSVRWSWLAVVERVTRAESSFSRKFASLIAALLALLEVLFVMAQRWLPRTSESFVSWDAWNADRL